jgi:hypothetical protein
MSKKKPKQYEIDTLEKLMNTASFENLERLSSDFVLWIHFNLSVIEEIRKENPKATKGKPNTELFQSNFVWIDDGKNELKFVRFQDSSTGEIKEVEIKKRK